ncbi:CaiB/BaiF CoA transferase family protein [Streptosporangium sp. NBC_01756]|uniref:CaiB/BaiF CoA transferase family protein n=1 Tax=Streptosporangium sp. NBC_01756 TaxID=2975950 RepID=UPI002DDB2D2C|nr:CoA transferase [Streptosporangium sp. NBC_01756]WSC85768.1 CoA transferase [Streptosporangium sp. NBC_01756]
MRPLEDIRIVAVEQYGAGPFGSLHLADLGAEVIKIEDPSTGGDVGRYVPPYAEGEDSLFFETFNRNKKSLSLDLSTEAGRTVFEDLVRVSDAVHSNLRGDVPAKMRVTYDDLRHLNPRIVCCSLTGFGMTGPRSAEPGYDYILQGLAGWMELTGEPDGPPAKSGLSLVDFSGGLVAAVALLAGVHRARRDGVGCDCDLSLYDTAMSMLTYVGTWALNTDFQPRRMPGSAHPSLVPFQNFRAADGWLVVGCAKEKFWHRLAALLDAVGPATVRPGTGPASSGPTGLGPAFSDPMSPESTGPGQAGPDPESAPAHPLAGDPRFATFADRRRNAAELLPRLDAVFVTRTVAEWLADLRPLGIPCGPVNDVRQALAEEHTAARSLVVTAEHGRFGTVRQLASPVRVGPGTPAYRRAPYRGEHFDEIVHGLLGYPPEQARRLAAAGAFGEERM